MGNPHLHKMPGQKVSPTGRFWRFILQLIEFFCSFYLYRRFRPNEPFRRATMAEKRMGGCFMALWPAVMAAIMSRAKSFDATVDSAMNSMMYGHVWMGWLYLGFMAVLGIGTWLVIKVAPKIPLSISVPMAMVAWPVLMWFLWTHEL